MGEISVKAGKWRVAEPQLREALDILDMERDQKTNAVIDKADILELLVDIFVGNSNKPLSVSNIRRAISKHREVLTIRKSVLGPTHILVAKSQINMGRLMQKIDKHSRAIPLFEKALAIQMSELGKTHAETRKTQQLLVVSQESN